MRRALLLAVLPFLLGAAAAATEEKKALPGFGEVPIYRPRDLAKARGVVLFVSGDGGWNLGVVDMARRLADRAIVVGLSMPAWQKQAERHAGTCWYPAGELETAAQAVEKLYALPRYVRPILVGYSSGATVVYGALAQAPSSTFRGGVSLGFCPDLEVKRRWCGTDAWKPGWDEKKKQSWLPEDPKMPEREGGGAKWIALQGTIDEVCAPAQTLAFVRRVPHAEVVSLGKVGHGFSVPARWGEAFDRAVSGMLEATSVLAPETHTVRRDAVHRSPEEVAAKLESLGLPLEIVWPRDARDVLIFVSGDGGWADLDEGVAKALAARGIAVVGWNTLRYFWLEKTPERFTQDLARLLAALPADLPIFAGGYSFGAETVPVVAASDPRSGLARIAGLVLLAPTAYATFEVSALDWIRSSTTPTTHPVARAIERSERPVLCLVPEDDGSSGCPDMKRPGYERATLPGGHHFGANYDDLASRVAAFVSNNDR
ncbi:MAG TPA: AcvB/VirJ family lysyl-phosphatidylglycerol hydrolase [Candidatus Polarisedimenticolaceae bacterium]|nr:AcvB/VirJ family lysyl-phosphatidylglycerol hydrolase [Candidatus Polarisedimenticolaceae bacterium]